jgi:hypothetical protein
MPGSLVDSLSMGEVPGSIPGSAPSFAIIEVLTFALHIQTSCVYFFRDFCANEEGAKWVSEYPTWWLQDAGLGGIDLLVCGGDVVCDMFFWEV